MKVVWKYELGLYDGVQVLELPVGSEPIHAGMQGMALCVWCLCDVAASVSSIKESHGFSVHGTGHTNVRDDARHIGSVFNHQFVWHVFHLADPNA